MSRVVRNGQGLPTGPARGRAQITHQTRERSVPPPRERSRYRRSEESVSSNGSSLFDRVRGGYESSRTSLDDDEAAAQYKSLRSRSNVEEPAPQPQADTSEGFSIWNKFSALTIDVSKAWSSTTSGEETPIGQESRLTRAMKEYHVSKARDPSELPDWLFEPHERGVGRLRAERKVEEPVREVREQPTRSRGLRDVYESAAPPVQRAPTRSYGGDEAPSKATNRLKAMRDARRGAATSYDEPRYEEPRPSVPVDVRQPPPRVGLPSGPGRARRL